MGNSSAGQQGSQSAGGCGLPLFPQPDRLPNIKLKKAMITKQRRMLHPLT